MTEEITKKGLLVKINKAFKKLCNDLFDGVDAEMAFDIAAIIAAIIGAVSLGIGIQFVNAIFIAPGLMMTIMGIFRLIYRLDDFN